MPQSLKMPLFNNAAWKKAPFYIMLLMEKAAQRNTRMVWNSYTTHTLLEPTGKKQFISGMQRNLGNGTMAWIWRFAF
jgi:hypothetical protein